MRRYDEENQCSRHFRGEVESLSVSDGREKQGQQAYRLQYFEGQAEFFLLKEIEGRQAEK